MAAKDDNINVPVLTGSGGVLGTAMGTLQEPIKAAADSLLLPGPEAILSGRVTFDQMRRLQIREDLLRDARANADDILTTASTRYSRDLTAMQTTLNDFIRQEPEKNTCAIYLDPAKFDAAMALGFEETSAIGRVLAQQGLKLNPDDWRDNVSLGVIADRTMSKYESRFGIHIYTQDGTLHPNVGAVTPTSVIIPSPDHALTSPIAGLSRKDDVDFTNRHEGWHAKDTRFNAGDVPHETYDKIAVFNIAVLSDDAEDYTRKVYISRHRDEILADVGAVGDMIRAGKDISVLDKVSAWRRSDPDDHRHMSVQVLDGLKAEISKMGIDKFRKLSDHAAKEKYYDIVADYGMNETALKAAAVYDVHELVPEVQAEMREKAKTDIDTAKGIAFLALVGDKAPREPAGENELKPGEDKIKDALSKWDAMQALQDRAFKDSGRITPATMVKAYSALSDGLRDAMEADPANHLIDLKMSKLQSTFIDVVPQMDYVEANKRFGVDIIALEPALDKYKPAPRTATRQTPPKAGG